MELINRKNELEQSGSLISSNELSGMSSYYQEKSRIESALHKEVVI